MGYNTYGVGERNNAGITNAMAGEDRYNPTYTVDYDNSPSDNYLTRDFEDRFNIVLDKNVPFKGDELDYGAIRNNCEMCRTHAKLNFGTRAVGMVNIFKFSPATT